MTNQNHSIEKDTESLKRLERTIESELYRRFFLSKRLSWIVLLIFLGFTLWCWHISFAHEVAGAKLAGTHPVDHYYSHVILAAGITFSLLVFILFWTVQKSHEISKRLVDKLTQRLVRRNAALESFTSNASHELAQPIDMIKSLAMQLVATTSKEPQSQCRELAEMILANSQAMSELIECLLQLAKVEINIETLQMVQTQKVLEAVIIQVQEQLDAVGGTIRYEVLPPVYGDEKQLQVLFANLLENAIKYRHETRALEIRIGVEETADYWCISVGDNGSGVTDQEGPDLFSLFSRGESTCQGHGVGLALCKSIVQRHLGEIWFERNINGGLTFYITLLKKDHQVRRKSDRV